MSKHTVPAASKRTRLFSSCYRLGNSPVNIYGSFTLWTDVEIQTIFHVIGQFLPTRLIGAMNGVHLAPINSSISRMISNRFVTLYSHLSKAPRIADFLNLTCSR